MYVFNRARPNNGGLSIVDRKMERKEEIKCGDDSSIGMQ
jgi:hypothetical protein